MLKSFLLLFFLVATVAVALALPPRHDYRGQYRPDRPQADIRREGDSLRLYVRFPAGTSPTGKSIFLATWPSYDAKQPVWRDSIRQVGRKWRSGKDARWLEVCLPASRLQAGQILSVQPAATPAADASREAWLELTAARLSRSYLLTDSIGEPLLRRYVRVGEAFSLSFYGPEQPFWVKQYTTEFTAALPPMTSASARPTRPRTLTIRDTLRFRAGQLVRLQQPGIYSVQSASTAIPAIGLLVEGNQYPTVTTAPELIEPLIYLTTSTERRQLYAATNPKQATDQFWLTIAGSDQNTARQLIRTYYGRVAEANRLFAAHKAGWMTDRGMLYVVLGPPDAVYRAGTEERWVYHAPTIASGTYVFRAKPSTFAPDNYDLVRRPEYEMLWYAAVDQWRKGLTARAAR